MRFRIVTTTTTTIVEGMEHARVSLPLAWSGIAPSNASGRRNSSAFLGTALTTLSELEGLARGRDGEPSMRNQVNAHCYALSWVG